MSPTSLKCVKDGEGPQVAAASLFTLATVWSLLTWPRVTTDARIGPIITPDSKWKRTQRAAAAWAKRTFKSVGWHLLIITTIWIHSNSNQACINSNKWGKYFCLTEAFWPHVPILQEKKEESKFHILTEFCMCTKKKITADYVITWGKFTVN